MPIHVKDGGIWRRAVTEVKDTAIWNPNLEDGGVHVHDGTSWHLASLAEDQLAGVITQGSDFLYTYIYSTPHFFSSYQVFARGYNSASDNDYEWTRTIAFGSMTLGADFWDSRGENRVISALYKVPYFYWTILMTLDGENIPDDDFTFKSITVEDTGGVREHLRSEAFFIGNTNGGTTWYWDESAGTPPFRRWVTDVALTVRVQFGL